MEKAPSVRPEEANPPAGQETIEGQENIDDIVSRYIDLDNGSPIESPSAETSSAQPEHELSAEKLEKIEEALGRSAMIATGFTEADRKNVMTEAVKIKTEQIMNGNKLAMLSTRVPIVGGVIKAGIAARQRSIAKRAIESEGDLNAAFTALNIDPSKSQVLNNDAEAIRERAWQTLENAGYSNNNQIESASSRLDSSNRVEKMDSGVSNLVKQALNDYYAELKAGGDKAEISSKFDKSIEAALSGKENLGVSIDLQKQKEGIEKLATDRAIEDQDLKNYLDNHVSLYKATMREGIYTEQKADSIVSAVVAGGIAGGVLAALSSREGTKSLRSAVSPAVTAMGAGAIVGAAAGAARGVSKARVKLSEAEINSATSFDEPAPVEQAPSELEPPVKPELPVAPERPTVSETADEKAWEDYYDAMEEYNARLSAYPDLEQKYNNDLAAYEAAKATAGSEASDSRAPESDAKRGNKISQVMSGIARFKRKLTGEEKYLQGIEKLRDRKDASSLIENFDDLMGKLNPVNQDSRQDLIDAYADAVARGRFSADKRIDLIKYRDGDQSLLEQKLAEVEKALYGEDPSAINSLLNDANSDLNKSINNRYDQLNQDFLEANKLRTRFIVRSALVDAASGALLGAVAGGVLDKLREAASEDGILAGIISHKSESTGETPSADSIELAKDPDGGFMVKLGDQELIGEGDAKGIEFGSDGALTADSREMLEGAGIHVEENITEHTFENATKNISLREFFNPANKDANGLTEVSDRSWITDNSGRDMVTLGDTHMDGDGNIILQVTPRNGADVDMDNMKLLLTPGDGNIDTGITVDVGPDGTIEIPADSPAASLFDGDSYRGGYGELIQEGTNGHVDVFHTIGDGHADINSITIDNPDAVYNEYSYTFDIDGQQYEVEVPDEITESARLEALNGFASVKGTGEPIGYENNGEITGLTTSSGEAVEVEHFEHHGGYSDYTDSYFGEKEGVYNSGASVIRQMVGNEGDGLSSREVDRIFLDKVNSGEIEEGDVIEEYLKTMGNSPEALTTTRAMMGNFEFDIDGDGTPELIDTQDEINLVSDIISRDPESYDAFVNDTYEMFYDKIEGGGIRFVDYTQERYDYTTWGVLGEDNNILQRLGVTGDRPTDGVGIIFTDKDGNSIYDEDTVRKLWHLPAGYELEYVSDRLNCIQKTSRGFFEQKTTDEKSTDEKTTTEKTTTEKTTGEGTIEKETDEKTTSEKSTGEKTTDEKSTDEKSTDEKSTGEKTTGEKTTDEKTTGEKSTDEKTTGEKTTDEKTTGEKSTDEKTTSEKTTSEDTIEPKDYENMQRIDNNIDNDIKQDIGTNEIHHNPNPGVSQEDLTEKPSASDYQGTEPKIVQNETSTHATPVQEKVSEPNNYSNNNGGAHANEYHPVEEHHEAQAAADNRGDTTATASDLDDVLGDVGIN